MTALLRDTQDVTSEAYHGTRESHAKVIISSGFRLPAENSRECRYGRGVYFWLNSKDQAVWSAKKMVTRGEVIAIVRAKVEYGKHLNLVSWDHQKLAIKVAKNLCRAPGGTITEAAVLNFMVEKGWIDSALILDFPDSQPRSPLFKGSYSVEGPRLILCVYRVEKILERTIVLTEAA